MPTANDIINDALMEIGALAQGETPSSGDSSFGLTRLNQLLDSWSAERRFVYAYNFAQFTLVPNLNPHTIGPGVGINSWSRTGGVITLVLAQAVQVAAGYPVVVANATSGNVGSSINGSYVYAGSTALTSTISLTQAGPVDAGAAGGSVSVNGVPTFICPGTVRPVKINNASIGLNTSPDTVYVPLNIRDHNWYAGQTIPSIATTLPTDVWYDPQIPNGALHFWPVPTAPYFARMELWSILAGNLTLASSFILPPGYQQALSLSLAEALFVPYGAAPNPLTLKRAAMSRAVIEINNVEAPTLTTRDYGLGGEPSSPYYNYLIGPLSGRN